MDKKKASLILGLPIEATRDEVTRRYDVLVRKRRKNKNETEAYSDEDLELAYSVLADIAYHDPVSEKRLLDRNARPGIIARLLKIEQSKFDNIIHYGKWPALGALAAVAFLVWFLATTVFREPNDFRMLFAGDIFVQDQEALEAEILEYLPGTVNPLVHNIQVSPETDPQMMAAVVQKLMVEVGFGENDILVVDRAIFEQYAPQGAFRPLDDRLHEFGTTEDEQQQQILSVSPEVLVDGEDGSPKVFGISVAESPFLMGIGVMGTDMIAVFGLRSEFPEKGAAIMKVLTAQ